MEHRAVRRIAAAEMMALHEAGESAALADADHIHLVVRLELVDQDAVARLEVAVAVELKLALEA